MTSPKLELAREALTEFTRDFRSSYLAEDVVWDFSGFEITELVDLGGDDVLGAGIQRGVLKGSAAVVEMPLVQIWTIREQRVQKIRIFASRDAGYRD